MASEHSPSLRIRPPGNAALNSGPLDVLEHASFLVTAVLFWHLVIGIRNPARASNGLGVLLLFAMAMQSVFLSLLLTFARTPWYAGYAETTAPWGSGPAHRPAAGRGHHVDPGGGLPGGGTHPAVAWGRATEPEGHGANRDPRNPAVPPLRLGR